MGELTEPEGDLYHAVARLAQRTPFVEVLAEAGTGLSIRYDGHVSRFQAPPRIRGAVMRAWTGGGWTEVSVSGVDPESVRFYEIFGNFKLAAIHVGAARSFEDGSPDLRMATMDAQVPRMLLQLERALEGEL